MPLTVHIVTPEKSFAPLQADSVVLPAFDGQVGILPKHAPFVCLLGRGELAIKSEHRAEARFALSGGVAQVDSDQVRILAEHVSDVASVTEADLVEQLRRLDEQDYEDGMALAEARSKAHWIAVQLKTKGKDVPPLKKL